MPIVIGTGLSLLAATLGVALSGSPTVLLRANAVPAATSLGATHRAAGACQGSEVMPAGASAIRLALLSDSGPRVSVSVLAGTHRLTGGVAPSGWTGSAVTVPVKPLPWTDAPVRVCFQLGQTAERVEIVGAPTKPSLAAHDRYGQPLAGRFTVEYLRSGGGSWYSLARAIARRIGLGREPAGSWIAPALAALMGATVAGACWALVRALR